MKMQTIRLVLLILPLLALTACAVNRDYTVPVEERSGSIEEGVKEPPATAQETVIAPVRPESAATQMPKYAEQQPAVVALLDESQRKTNAGQYESAVADLERAIRLEPKNAVLWHRLASTRFRQQQWQQVISLAQKSNSLAAGDPELQRQNWKMIATAKLALGDKEGAQEAGRKAGQ